MWYHEKKMSGMFTIFCIGQKIHYKWSILILKGFIPGDLQPCSLKQCILIHLSQWSNMYHGPLISVHHDAPVNCNIPTLYGATSVQLHEGYSRHISLDPLSEAMACTDRITQPCWACEGQLLLGLSLEAYAPTHTDCPHGAVSNGPWGQESRGNLSKL